MDELLFTYYQSPLGQIRIGGTPDYISEVTFHDKIQKSPANARNLPALFIQCLEQLIQYFNGELKTFHLPLHQKGTPFQKEVWNELMQIPYGKTITYQELAKRLGDAKATRAVANVIAKNQLMIIVPCHRVVGSHGELTGYGGELWRKKWLLEFEAKKTYGIRTLF
ncbi:MAG: methylated-DNA--[protein]-cysteine S-methyltransferase [Chitinophagaceae bacterium]|nr:methylated-DNA--[protein]-cysteine S-methyltransferase [Chitinophagaceae bacterium]